MVAAGIKKAVGCATHHLTVGPGPRSWLRVAIHLVSDIAFRRILRIGRLRFRVAAAVLALGMVPVGLSVAWLQILVGQCC